EEEWLAGIDVVDECEVPQCVENAGQRSSDFEQSRRTAAVDAEGCGSARALLDGQGELGCAMGVDAMASREGRTSGRNRPRRYRARGYCLPLRGLRCEGTRILHSKGTRSAEVSRDCLLRCRLRHASATGQGQNRLTAAPRREHQWTRRDVV